MVFRCAHKKICTAFVCVVFSIVSLTFLFSPINADATGLGLRSGWYYRIKNAATGYYLTVSNTGETCATLT